MTQNNGIDSVAINGIVDDLIKDVNKYKSDHMGERLPGLPKPFLKIHQTLIELPPSYHIEANTMVKSLQLNCSTDALIQCNPRTMKVDIYGDVRLTHKANTPVAFNYIEGDFQFTDSTITTFQGFPEEVGGDLRANNNPGITSLDYLPSKIGKSAWIHRCGFTSLQGIHKKIKSIGDCLYIGQEVTSHILGVLLIKGIRNFHMYKSDNSPREEQETVAKINDIMCKHLITKDINLCQDDLIDAGLADYAKL